MPSAIRNTPSPVGSGITKFTNCRLLRGNALVEEDLWISSTTGKILQSQAVFYDENTLPDETINLGGRIIAPGFIDCQLNGAYNFNFSTLLDDPSQYGKRLREVNKQLIKTGVTSYVPTLTSQERDLYHKVVPFLAPSRETQTAQDGAESLGAHVEGPFLSPGKNGVHNPGCFQQANTFDDIERVYGRENLSPDASGKPAAIKMITLAPEIANMTNQIPELVQRGIVVAIGHSEATYEDATAAVAKGATMITHLFNAMLPLHHRNPGIFGVLGEAESLPRPYFGIIADGVHLHPTSIKIAFNAHPDGFILVTDAMHMLGCPDGPYPWTNGGKPVHLVKKGNLLLLENSNTLAGSTITLIECVENFLKWSGCTVPQALNAVTSTPARMLQLEGIKGSLDPGADADLVILSDDNFSTGKKLTVDEVWKFGTRV